MVSLSRTVAHHRIFYPRPIRAMPDILMIDMPAEFCSASLPLGRYYPILIETLAEQRELEAFLDDECQVPRPPDLLDARPSGLATDHVTVAHYGPPGAYWPYVLLCRWPPDLTEVMPEKLRIFARRVYTIELFAARAQLERASDMLLTLLKRRSGVRIEIVFADWSAEPGAAPH